MRGSVPEDSEESDIAESRSFSLRSTCSSATTVTQTSDSDHATGSHLLVPVSAASRHSSIRGSNSAASLTKQNDGLDSGPQFMAIARPGSDPNSDINRLTVEPEMLSKVRRWMLTLLMVEFDVELGPVIRYAYPSFHLEPAEAQNVAFSSLPDSLQFEQGSQVHSFRICDSHGRTSTGSTNMRPPSPDGFLYGYSYFSQRRDDNMRRGYQQQSLVILTHHQYPSLFCALALMLGPLFESHGTPILEAVCHGIASWPNPSPGTTVELPLLGSVLETELPQAIDSQQSTETSSFRQKFDPRRHILASTAPLMAPPVMLFQASLTHLWSLWECLVLCEPILIFGTSPALTSQAVWWLRDLLRPIPLTGDIRPYFTIHDMDYSRLVNNMPPKAGLLLGVTNPVFEKSCIHWPHVLSLGRRSASRAAAGPSPGWKTETHKRYISKDRRLLKQIEDACRGGEQQQIEASLNLRRHFCSRTMALLVPLNRYLHTLIPSPAERAGSSPSLVTVRLKPFSSSDFLASLKLQQPPLLPFRSSRKQREFYEHWLKTPAFGLWLARQEEVVHGVLTDAAI